MSAWRGRLTPDNRKGSSMTPTDETDDDATFELLALSAGVPDIPLRCEPIAACEVMMPTDAVAPVTDDPMPWTVLCGYGPAVVQVGNEWRHIVVLALVATEPLTEIFEQGPGAFVESTWMRQAIADDDVLSFAIATWDESSDTTRRFGVRIPPTVECSELANVDVFALSLLALDDDPSDDPGDDANEYDDVSDPDGLSWFVENDPSMWTTV